MKASHHFHLILLTTLIFLVRNLGFPTSLIAQAPTVLPEKTISSVDSVEFAFLPALAYNSDFGLIGGGILSRYHYRDNQRPFYSYMIVNAIASTKGLISSSIFYDKPNVFNSNQRLTSEGYVARFLQNQYFGIGNYDKLEKEPEGIPDFYLYNSFSTGFEFILRRPLIVYINNAQLDVFGVINFDYRTPWGNDSDRLITVDQPAGIKGARTAALGTGLIWENRNNEFAPTQGSYAKAGIEIGQKLYGSSSNYLIFNSEARAYTSFQMIRQITFANRISFDHTSGSMPYWKLAELGGEVSMRGYPENRFRDDNALFINTELRTWLWEFPEVDVRLGGTLFMDIGRTFPTGMTLTNIFSDLNYTYGFGANSSFFNENFIFRGDIGFSDEGYGIYFTAGYMF